MMMYLRENTNFSFFCSLTKPQSFADCVGDELPVGSNYHQDDQNYHDEKDDDNNDANNHEFFRWVGSKS